MKSKNKGKKSYSVSKRLRAIMLCFFILLFLLIIRLAFLQFVQGSDLKEKMYSQLIKSDSISPKRGTIYDATGKALAISAQVDTVSIHPSYIVIKNGNKIDEDKPRI